MELGWVLLQMVEARVLSWIAKGAGRRSALLSETKPLQRLRSGLHSKVSSLLKSSEPCFRKKSVFLCELRHRGDDYGLLE